MIGGNGSYVEHHGQVLMHELISKEDTAKVVDWLTERYLAFYLESNNGLFASSDFQERARETLKTYAIQKGQSEESVAGKKPEYFLHGLQYGGELYRDEMCIRDSNMSIDKVVILLRLDANQEKILRIKYGR